MDKEEYYCNGDYVKIFAEVKDKDHLVVVENYDGVLDIVRKSDLQKKEDTYSFQMAEKHRKELEEITRKAEKDFDKLVDKLINKAIRSLQSRIKFNVVFGQGGTSSAYALVLSEQLEGLIKEEAKEVIKKDKDILS